METTNLHSIKKININKTLRLIALILLCAAASTNTSAQTDQTNAEEEKHKTSPSKIKGTIYDEQGVPLTGATVVLKGTTVATVADTEGNFSIEIPNNKAILTISFVGYTSKEFEVTEGLIADFKLYPSLHNIEEVVVTALGIKREERQLGYSQQTVDNESLTQARSNNWSEALKGKVAGLNITNGPGGPMNTQEIKLRGNNSLNLNGNNALIVVDGIPISNEIVVSGSGSGDPGDPENNPAYMGNDTHVDFGNGAADINPDDIETVTVLKGAGATALYGSRAANGAIIITTKSGNKHKGLGITFSSNVSFDVIQKHPNWQYEYGQGNNYKNANGENYYSYGVSEDGNATYGTSSAYGPRFDGQEYFQYDPTTEKAGTTRTPWVPYTNNRSDFWEIGKTTTNNISISGSGDKGSGRLSLTYTNNDWIMPNMGFERLTLSTKNTYELNKFIKLNSSISYTNNTSDNLPGTGYNNNSISYFMIFQNPNVDLNWYTPIWKKDGYKTEQIQPFSSYITNPYLIAYEVINSNKSNKLTGNISTDIQFTPQVKLMVRSGISSDQQNRDQRQPFDVSRHPNGYYKIQNIFIQESNTDALLTYNNKNKKDLYFTASLGGNMMNYQYKRTDITINDLKDPDIYSIANAQDAPQVRTYDKNKKVHSVYGLASFGYKDMMYLDLTGRNDWSSTLPKQNWSFFYPSINTSFILNELFTLPKTVNFLKLRMSFAEVGNDAAPYYTEKYYNNSNFAGSSTLPTTIYNANFEPEQTISYETGLEYKLLNKRLGGDITIYQTLTNNQILTVPVLYETGYNKALVNSGEVRNRGLELVLYGSPIKTKSLEWTITGTWAKNNSEILSLADGLEGEQQIAAGGDAKIIAKVGGSATAIYGYGFVKSPDGEIVFDEKTGLPKRSSQISYQGDGLPKWKAGLVNEIKYKNLQFNIVFDAQYGGIIYSQTHHKASEQGKLTNTLAGREEGYIIGDGVVENSDGTYSTNTTKVTDIPLYYKEYYRRANVEANSFNASYLKLREISFKYSFTPNILKKMKIQNMDVSIYGRNLYTWSAFPIYDPETGALSGSSILPGIEMGQLPTPATYGAALKLNF